MNTIYKDFVTAVENFDFEASDDKLKVIHKIENQSDVFALVKLMMDFAYEEGYSTGSYEATEGTLP